METRHEASHDESEALRDEWLPLAAAAHALGLSERAVQMRAANGKLRRTRIDGRVHFAVRATERAVQPAGNEAASRSVREVHEEGGGARWELVEHLRAEVDFLRAELSAVRTGRDVAESELRRLLLADREELRRLRAQLAIAEAPQNEEASAGQDAAPPESMGSTEEAMPAPRKAGFWGRLFGRK